MREGQDSDPLFTLLQASRRKSEDTIQTSFDYDNDNDNDNNDNNNNMMMMIIEYGVCFTESPR